MSDQVEPVKALVRYEFDIHPSRNEIVVRPTPNGRFMLAEEVFTAISAPVAQQQVDPFFTGAAPIDNGCVPVQQPQCSPELTECPRCKNNVTKCDGAFKTQPPVAWELVTNAGVVVREVEVSRTPPDYERFPGMLGQLRTWDKISPKGAPHRWRGLYSELQSDLSKGLKLATAKLIEKSIACERLTESGVGSSEYRRSLEQMAAIYKEAAKLICAVQIKVKP